ncbi:MAG: hypothetical protein HY054_02795 [Proteobacteria bacterium]|nr:hypothetical protein [Pseudomonadota bacterium]
MSSEWLPIRYRDFWDLPRAFSVDYDGKTYFFDCPFNESIDDYQQNTPSIWWMT